METVQLRMFTFHVTIQSLISSKFVPYPPHGNNSNCTCSTSHDSSIQTKRYTPSHICHTETLTPAWISWIHNMCISKRSSELTCSTFSWFFHSNKMLPSFHICHTENFESCMNLMDLITCVYSNDPQNWLNYHTQYIPIQNWNLYPYLIPLFRPFTLPFLPLNCHCIHLSLSVWTSVLMYHPQFNYQTPYQSLFQPPFPSPIQLWFLSFLIYPQPQLLSPPSISFHWSFPSFVVSISFFSLHYQH